MRVNTAAIAAEIGFIFPPAAVITLIRLALLGTFPQGKAFLLPRSKKNRIIPKKEVDLLAFFGYNTLA